MTFDQQDEIELAKLAVELHERAVAFHKARQTLEDSHMPLEVGGLVIGVNNVHVIVMDGIYEVYDWQVESTDRNCRHVRVNAELVPKVLDQLRQMMILDDLASV